jgi:hypothetical protein
MKDESFNCHHNIDELLAVGVNKLFVSSFITFTQESYHYFYQGNLPSNSGSPGLCKKCSGLCLVSDP